MYDAKDVENLLERCKAEGKSKADTIRLLAELCLGWPYVWASQGERCTPEWRRNRIPYCREQKYADMIRDNCPVLCEKQPACYGCKWDGVLCFDCRGFTRKLCEWVGAPLFGESVTTQWETSSNWAAKGNIDTMPHGLVCCVFRPKHTGMYMGDETVIHCSGTVKRESLPGKPKWERWGIPAGLYTTDELRKAGVNVDESKNIPTLRRGSRGEQVKLLQETLNELPAGAALDLKVDGIFGAETEKAVRQFQADHGLTVDGIVGRKTWAALGVASPLSSRGSRSEVEGPPSVVEASEESPSADDVPDTSRDNATLIWEKLMIIVNDNPFAAAGIMGNMWAESSLIPNNLQGSGNRALGMTDAEYTAAVDSGAYTAEQFTDDGYGYGIAQWTYRTRKAALLRFAKEHGKSIGNLDMQLDFLMDELLGSYSSVWYALSNATTVREASDAVLLKYERPKNTSEENQQRRAEIGQEFFARFADVDSEPETTPGETIAVDRTTLKALYAQAMAMAGTLKKIIEGE